MSAHGCRAKNARLRTASHYAHDFVEVRTKARDAVSPIFATNARGVRNVSQHKNARAVRTHERQKGGPLSLPASRAHARGARLSRIFAPKHARGFGQLRTTARDSQIRPVQGANIADRRKYLRSVLGGQYCRE